MLHREQRDLLANRLEALLTGVLSIRDIPPLIPARIVGDNVDAFGIYTNLRTTDRWIEARLTRLY